MSISRRKFLQGAILLHGISSISTSILANPPIKKLKRVRPGDTLWPSPEKWKQLNKRVNGKLLKIDSPLNACKPSAGDAACEQLFKNLKNPYYIGDTPALTQTSGWLDAWQAEPSVYAVAAKSTADVVAAVNFARTNNLRLVVKGGGHSYQGTSNSADSLLVWTREMNKIEVHDNFVAQNCNEKQVSQPAVTIGSGAMWLQAYEAVTTKAGRYVQGGGCATVGVAGLIQSGGFGSFSKNYGMAAAALLEAEVVIADGTVKIANACTNPDLFWALKGGGGGSFGVVTKLTLRTRELPEKFGGVFGSIRASDDESYKLLINKIISHYQSQLFNPHWGESISFHTDNTVNFNMVFHGISQAQATTSWHEFESWLKASPQKYQIKSPLTILEIPAKHLWDTAFLKKYLPDLILSDDRPQAPAENIYWASAKDEAGQYLYGYHSAWLPDSFLAKNNQPTLARAIFAASRHWKISLHFNKGLAGSPEAEIAAAKDTAMNPAVLKAFALVIIAGEGAPAFAGIPGYEPDIKRARRGAYKINQAMAEVHKIVPDAGSYVSESNYFEKNWKKSFWGSNYYRLSKIKKKYDPEGLFFVHHGVGSDEWSADGFTRIQR